MKVKAKARDCQLTVSVKASFAEKVDEKELDRFARVYLRGFLKPKTVKKKRAEYVGPVGIRLYERLKKPIAKRDFLFVIEQVVMAVQKLQASGLPLHPLSLDLQNVFINEVTKELQFLYIPMITKKGSTASVAEFLEAIIYSAQPADEKDGEFLSNFVYYFRSVKPFQIEKIEKFIIKEDRSVVDTIKKQNAGQSGFMTSKQQHYYEHYRQQDDDEATELLTQEDEATGLLSQEEATGLLQDEATGLLSQDGMDAPACGEKKAYVHFPALLRVGTEEQISINKPVFRLGKEEKFADYFVTNNIAVSRSHADIITRGQRYFVKDLNSKNHTFLNGEELPVQCEMEIHDGDCLKLANEEFIFHV